MYRGSYVWGPTHLIHESKPVKRLRHSSALCCRATYCNHLHYISLWVCLRILVWPQLHYRRRILTHPHPASKDFHFATSAADRLPHPDLLIEDYLSVEAKGGTRDLLRFFFFFSGLENCVDIVEEPVCSVLFWFWSQLCGFFMACCYWWWFELNQKAQSSVHSPFAPLAFLAVCVYGVYVRACVCVAMPTKA